MAESLDHINPGNSVRILHITHGALKPKLLEMGLITGKEIQVLFKAPFGDPIAVDVNGYILSLRLDEASQVMVEPILETVNS
jgi:ferrous iron transport protein A